jgi:hypothetical protein
MKIALDVSDEIIERAVNQAVRDALAGWRIEDDIRRMIELHGTDGLRRMVEEAVANNEPIRAIIRDNNASRK